MYNITDLTDMSTDELIAIAEGMGINKPDPSRKEELIYKILDQQAINGAASAAQNTEKKPKRQKKTAKTEKPADTKAETDASEAPADDKARTQKRTRKKKAETTDTDAGAQADMPAELPAAESANAESPAADSAPEADTQPEQKKTRQKQKRKAKADNNPDNAAQQDANAAPEAAAQNTVPEIAETAVSAEAPADAVASELPAAKPEVLPAPQKKDAAFDQFFHRSEGRKFVPRSQQEREEAAAKRQQEQQQQQEQTAPQEQPQQQQQGKKNKKQNQPQQPQQPQGPLQPQTIVLGEPGQPLPNPPGTGKKNRKNRFNQQNQLPLVPDYDFDNFLEAAGVLEIVPEGHGFLRSSDYNYMPSPDDILLTQQQIKSYGLKSGDVVECAVRPPRENEKYFPMTSVYRVNGRSPEFIRDRVPFEHLTPLFPDEKFDLTGGPTTCNISTRECAQSKCNPFEGLNLTGQQQAQLKELREQHAAKNKEKCEKARKDKAEARECRKECKKNYLAQVKAILTPEQYVTFLENTYINTNNRGKAAMKNRKHDGKCDKNSQNHNRPYCKYPKKVQQ